jgi:ubiquinone/menaquinone biosynthesis C-methylase UbiE
MNGQNIFDTCYEEYDAWFDENRFAYLSELEVLKNMMNEPAESLEIGVGSGRFAAPLGVQTGIDPSPAMLKIASQRGIQTIVAKGEHLPFPENTFDLVLIMVTLCYAENIQKVLQEANRVLRKRGKIIVGIIDRESKLGKSYEKRKAQSKFYQPANFLSATDVLNLLEKHAFQKLRAFQTIFHSPKNMISVESSKPGHGHGGFVAIEGIKQERG